MRHERNGREAPPPGPPPPDLTYNGWYLKTIADICRGLDAVDMHFD